MSSSTIAPPTGLAARVQQVGADIAALAECSPTSVTVAELGPLLVELEHLQDRLAGVHAGLLSEFDAAGGPDEHGAPSLNVWARRELRITPAETNRRKKRAAALEVLPETRSALAAGVIGLAHLDAIAHGIHQIGPDPISAVEPILLEVARTCDANAVRETVRKVRDTLDPDAAIAAYLRALERRDITLTAVGEGFAVNGFLDPEVGVKVKALLYSFGKKTSLDDDRTPGQRRVDALGDLCTTILNHGLPTDRGLRPQLYVTVPADRLESTTTGDPRVGEPAVLQGFGPISDQLLARLACDCTITPVTTSHDGSHVLDVGRTSRLATLKQRHAIGVQQDGVCFNPGCDRTRLEIHHMVAWSIGGPTDMSNLRGYCTRCHHLIHLGLLIVTPNSNSGWDHETKHRQFLPQRKRKATNLTRIYLHALTHAGKAHALHTTQQYRQGHTVIRR